MLSFTDIRAPRVSLKSRKVTSSGILTGFWLLLDPRRSGRRRKGRRAAPRVIVGAPPNQHGHNPWARPQAVEDHIVAFLRHVFAVDGNQTVSHLKRALLRKKKLKCVTQCLDWNNSLPLLPSFLLIQASLLPQLLYCQGSHVWRRFPAHRWSCLP